MNTSDMEKPALNLESLSFLPINLSLGARPWSYFERAWLHLTGYRPQHFQFVAGSTPLSTAQETAAVIITYYVVILTGRVFMRNRPALKLNGLFMLHNLYLTITSGILLLLFMEQLIPEIYDNGLFHSICSLEGGWTNHLIPLYYV